MDDVTSLCEAECRDLLETDCVGRVAFVTPAGPRIVPVNYAVAGSCLEWRTTAASEVAVYGPGHEVAFEVDNLDGERRRGWSVVAHGMCERADASVPSPRRTAWAEMHGPGPRPWAGGDRPLLLRLPWRELTGRRVGGVHWPHPVVSGRGRLY